MYSSFLWFEDPCPCEVCQTLRESFLRAYHAVQQADRQAACYTSVANAAGVVGEAAENLHLEHRPELYLGLANLNLESGHEVEAPKSSPCPGDDNSSSSKFLVCDHCMAHGLVCNEASVCEQCRSYGQPCIHRWCSTSPTSKEDCPNPKCHYTHMDSIPHYEKEPKWIIFKGDLPHHLSRGKLPSLAYMQLPTSIDFDTWMALLNARQEDGVRIFTKAGAKDAQYEGRYIQCRCSES